MISSKNYAFPHAFGDRIALLQASGIAFHPTGGKRLLVTPTGCRLTASGPRPSLATGAQPAVRLVVRAHRRYHPNHAISVPDPTFGFASRTVHRGVIVHITA
jgi:hypothetical protein